MDESSLLNRNRTIATATVTLVVLGAMAIGLAGKQAQFEAALAGPPLWILGIAVGLHLFWLLCRSEAWVVCVEAAGGSAPRRRVYQAASVGYLAHIFNGQVGAVMRVAALRQSEPHASPPAPALFASEMPIVVVEACLGALLSFTLVGPLGLPWWVPIVALGAMAAVAFVMAASARGRREGFRRGFAVMNRLSGRGRVIGLVVAAFAAQVIRTWLLLRFSGVDASVLDSVALLIGVGVIGLLPLGPSVGMAATVLILGAGGVAAAAAAGALLTVTGAVAILCFASWALVDRLRGDAPAQLAIQEA